MDGRPRPAAGCSWGSRPHNTDFLRWLTGANATKVFAQANTFSDLASPAQSVMAQIIFENGVMAHLWISSELPSPGMPEQRGPLPGRRPRRHHRPGELRVPRPGEGGPVGADRDARAVRLPQGAEVCRSGCIPISVSIQEFVDSIREQASSPSRGRTKAGRPSRFARPA